MTGSTRGIGYSIREFASHGANVMLSGTTEKVNSVADEFIKRVIKFRILRQSYR